MQLLFQPIKSPSINVKQRHLTIFEETIDYQYKYNRAFRILLYKKEVFFEYK